MENKNDNKQNKNGLPNKSFIIITLLSAYFLLVYDFLCTKANRGKHQY